MAYPKYFDLLMEDPLDPRLEALIAPVRQSHLAELPDPEWYEQMRAALREIMIERGMLDGFEVRI